jgi:hypothetical protein
MERGVIAEKGGSTSEDGGWGNLSHETGDVMGIWINNQLRKNTTG